MEIMQQNKKLKNYLDLNKKTINIKPIKKSPIIFEKKVIEKVPLMSLDYRFFSGIKFYREEEFLRPFTNLASFPIENGIPINHPARQQIFKYNNSYYNLILDFVGVAYNIDLNSGKVLNWSDIGFRLLRLSQGSERLFLPDMENSPQSISLSDRANAWIHGFSSNIPLNLINRPLKIKSGDNLIQEFYNENASTIEINLIVKGHYEISEDQK